MSTKTLRGYAQNEIKMREIDRRHPGLWGPTWRLAEREAAAKRMAERERKRAKRERLDTVPLHQAAHGADVDAMPRGSEIIQSREVLDLLPVIENQHFDPLFDGWGSPERGEAVSIWFREHGINAKPKWQRQLIARERHRARGHTVQP